MGVFSKVFKGKDGKKNDLNSKDLPQIPQKPTWIDAWTRTVLQPEEVHDLLRSCTTELKGRGLDVPFLLLPFRPASDLSATRTFIRNYFGPDSLKSDPPRGEQLLQELKLTEPLVIAGVLKWCWSRIPGGVVTWEAYELFKIGEHDSSFAPDAFTTFIPISVGSGARSKIIFDFFDLFSAIAAHGKVNGFGGRKLSRYAAWWAFEFSDSGNGFEGGYRTWTQAADATSHLFFAYLRSVSPNAAQSKSILGLPRALQQLLDNTEYPPVAQQALQSKTSKVVMVVDSVSPTPFALLRRAKNFHYREEDTALRHFSDFDDPVAALTNECKRVLKSISSANESTTAKHSTSLRDASWSRFEDIGFGALSGEFESADEPDESTLSRRQPQFGDLRSSAASKSNDLGRPTTPSWADFMSSGFQEQVPNGNPSVLLPPDKILPPIDTRSHHSAPAHKLDNESTLEPGELANISSFELDDTFWWVWMTSLAGEEPSERKAAFGRCALVETKYGNQWIVMEEVIKGAAPEPDETAYVAEKRSRFGFSTRKKLTRSKSTAKGALAQSETNLNRNKATALMSSKTSIAPDQHARIQAAAAALQERNRPQSDETPISPRRARMGDDMSTKTNSVLTLQPLIMSEAAPALQWASKYDKSAIRAKYLGDSFAGRGSNVSLLNNPTADDSAKALHATANGTAHVPAVYSAEQDKENRPIAKRAASPEPRDEALKVPAGNPTLLEVLQKGPPGSKPYQGSPPKKPVPVETHKATVEAPRVPPKDNSIVRKEVNAAPVADLTNAVKSQDKPQQQTVVQPQVSDEAPPVVPKDTAPAPSLPAEQASAPAAQPQGPIQIPRSAPPQNPASTPSQAPIPTNAQTSMSPQTSPTTAGGRPSSPETSRKLQKKGGQGSGLKGIFSRKKRDEPIQDFTARKPSGNSSAVAAARAALEAKATDSNKAPVPPARVTSKRFSAIGRKPEPESVAAPISEPASVPITQPTAPFVQVDREPKIEEEPPAPLPKDTPKETPVDTPHDDHESQSLADEERRAEREFRTFDQGPLHDAPAFVPADTPSVSTDTPARKDSVQPEEHDVSPLGETPPPTVVSAEKEAEEEEEEAISPNDRWAQIRKNAAERAALTRPSEEQSRRTDDDGDTSGEETIESRVARIKARVAELTGNMDLPNNRRAN